LAFIIRINISLHSPTDYYLIPKMTASCRLQTELEVKAIMTERGPAGVLPVGVMRF